MKIEVYTICYNEELLLPYFLRHYSAFCDKIFIFDNHSTDRSLEICAQNPKVTVTPYDSNNEIRDDIYLAIKNNCWKESKADWVIICDLDEFVYNFHEIIGLNNYDIISPDWWEMISDHFPVTEGHIWEDINQGVNLGQATKCVMFRPTEVKDINYQAGCHEIKPDHHVKILRTSEILLLHYKMLTAQYVIDRHAMYCKRMSKINKKRHWGFHYYRSEEEVTKFFNEFWNKKELLPV